jgi:anion-transporting  ArsA/GET3 family ATPase
MAGSTVVRQADSLLDHSLLFVTGKGGVGKSSVAAALGLLAAEQGKKTLLCEVEPKGDLSELLEMGPTGFTPKKAQENLWVMSMDTEASLREYLKLNLHVPVAGRIGPLAKAFDFVATAAPGVREILVVGKLCWEVRERNWDLIVVDASASGHVVGQLAAPQAINQLVAVGLVRQQTNWMLAILSDPAQTSLCIVCTPEEMPVSETIELSKRVENETTVTLSTVIVNRVLPEPFGRSEEEVFERLCQPENSSLMAKELGGDVEPLLEGAQLAVNMRRTRAGHLERLRKELSPEVAMIYLPYLFNRAHGKRATRQLAQSLAEEIVQ